MEQYDGIKVQYTHPAIPPYGIKLNRTYEVKATKQEIYIITDVKEKLILSEYILKVLFELTSGKWEDLVK